MVIVINIISWAPLSSVQGKLGPGQFDHHHHKNDLYKSAELLSKEKTPSDLLVDAKHLKHNVSGDEDDDDHHHYYDDWPVIPNIMMTMTIVILKGSIQKMPLFGTTSQGNISDDRQW